MKIAMGALAVLAIIGGFVQIPGVTDGLHHFLEPTFADSAAATRSSSRRPRRVDRPARRRGDRRSPASSSPTGSGSSGRERAAASRRASRALHKFFVNKWYFDEAIDFLIVRPVAWLGRFANSTFERVFVNGALVGGATGAVRALSAAVRGVQSGYLRYYAALLLVGAHRPGRLLPDLRMTIHLTILIFFPAAAAACSARSPRRSRRSSR